MPSPCKVLWYLLRIRPTTFLTSYNQVGSKYQQRMGEWSYQIDFIKSRKKSKRNRAGNQR